ncbi:MAG TPA: UrcA family protein [Gammaproteobacteria bacterium]|nr:UrcA family protein [Gammaproteobacteria bacterium]
MKRTFWSLSATCFALAAGITITAGASIAEEAADTLWIIVKAPRVQREVVEATSTNTTIERVSLTHEVSYAGLDLAMYADVRELQKRIKEGAETACAQLDVLYPLADLDTAACVEQAVSGAMAQAEEVIATANRL